MTFKLKKEVEGFALVDGPDAGKAFEKGQSYDKVPTGYKDRFEAVKKPVEAADPKQESKSKKAGGKK